jgi:uncharacterized protein (DUF1501 family)
MTRNVNTNVSSVTRRDLLTDAVFGIAGIGLCQLLSSDRLLRAEDPSRSAVTDAAAARAETRSQPAATSTATGSAAIDGVARGQAVIHIFLGGGLSQVDSFDHKPALQRFHDRDLPADFKADAFFGKIGRLHQSHYSFRPRGQSGLEISDLFPHLAELADELTIVRSMKAETANHIPGIFQANTGFRNMGFPAMGAWLSYGLAAQTKDLPTFVVLPDARGIPNAAGGAFNWANGFLPAQHQGVPLSTKGEQPIADLTPSGSLAGRVRESQLKLLDAMNRRHLQQVDAALADPLLARIQSYELAARMQTAIPEALDFASETKAVQQRYGLDRAECRDTARNCLAARRLIERGVRTVQLWTGDGVSWDAHEDITGNGYKSHTGEALRVDQPIAALIEDLKQRGLLDSTLVLITSEFGRTPYAQSQAGTLGKGRDHHPEAFCAVMAGAGLRPGFAYGATDELGYNSVENVVTWPDLHATVLHLLGLHHERLTFYHNGIQRRLTNVHGHVLHDLFA